MIATTALTAPAAFDPTDVPRVDADHLARMLDLLVGSSQGLTMLRGTDAAAMTALERDFWRDFIGETATGVATLVRFRALMDAFASRRLKSLLLHEGYAVLQAAFNVAAGIRLSTARGFNPQGLVWAVTAELAASRRQLGVHHDESRRIAA